nr:polypeptide deformylase [Salmonella sp. NCTC 7297]
MSVLQVLHIPDERLRKVATPVEEVNAEIQRIVDDMFETMYAEEGIGLAATQVDIHQRIIVIDVSENRDERLVLINPELLEKKRRNGYRRRLPVDSGTARFSAARRESENPRAGSRRQSV